MLSAQTRFVQVDGLQFRLEGQPYHPVGANFWYGMDLGASIEGQARLERELDRMAALGINNLRIMGASEGPDGEPWRVQPALQPEPGEFREEIWVGLDYLLRAMSQRDMHAVICLGNFWPWSGGFGQYLAWVKGDSIPYPPPQPGGTWAKYMYFSSRFYQNKEAVSLYRSLIHRLLSRTNSLTGVAYKDDPTIMAWQLANEPRGLEQSRAFLRWVDQSAALVKSLAPQQLVSIGSEGQTPSKLAGTLFKKAHRSDYIDYCTMHIWPENWGWYDPLKAEQSFPVALEKAKQYVEIHQKVAGRIGKPLVLEEFGMARDQRDMGDGSSTEFRNQFYGFLLEQVQLSVQEGGALQGLNFWAWGGEGRPREAGGFWQRGDDFIGDPAHEEQGWYSVYDSDRSTQVLIWQWIQKIQTE